MSDKFAAKIQNMSFEEAINELEKIVRNLESGEATLENSIEKYELGNALSKFCEKKLKDAQLKVAKIMQKEDKVVTEPVELD